MLGHPEVRHAFVTSGIRHDLLIGRIVEGGKKNRLDAYTRQLASRHVSGGLNVVPGYTSERVLVLMHNLSFGSCEAFKGRFDELCAWEGLKQELIPHFLSSHPGCTIEDMADLAVRTKRLGYRLEQVQDFTPAPMTLAADIPWSAAVGMRHRLVHGYDSVDWARVPKTIENDLPPLLCLLKALLPEKMSP